MCRRTLTGHKDDVLHITGLRLSDPAAEPRSAIGEREASPPPDPGLGALFATSRCRRRLQSPLNCLFHIPLRHSCQQPAKCSVHSSVCTGRIVGLVKPGFGGLSFRSLCVFVVAVPTAASGCGARAAGPASASSPARQRTPPRRRAPSCRQP